MSSASLVGFLSGSSGYFALPITRAVSLLVMLGSVRAWMAGAGVGGLGLEVALPGFG